MSAEITVLPELKAYIDPLTPDEHDALARSIRAEGCPDALVLGAISWWTGTTATAFAKNMACPFKPCKTPSLRAWKTCTCG